MRLALDVRLKLPSHRAHRAHTAHSIVGQAAEDPVLVLEAREHFFTHGNVPHFALTLLLGDAPADGRESLRRRAGPDPEEGLEESQQPLYRELKRWRNDRAWEDGKPAYVIARNVQLAEIARSVPRSLAGPKEIDGIGEAFCRIAQCSVGSH